MEWDLTKKKWRISPSNLTKHIRIWKSLGESLVILPQGDPLKRNRAMLIQNNPFFNVEIYDSRSVLPRVSHKECHSKSVLPRVFYQECLSKILSSSSYDSVTPMLSHQQALTNWVIPSVSNQECHANRTSRKVFLPKQGLKRRMSFRVRGFHLVFKWTRKMTPPRWSTLIKHRPCMLFGEKRRSRSRRRNLV